MVHFRFNELHIDLVLFRFFTLLPPPQIEGSWQLCIQQVCWCCFSNSMCSFRVSVLYFANSHNIHNFLIIISYGDLCLVSSGVTILIVIGHHKLHPI